MKFTIVIPARNAASSLCLCLKHISGLNRRDLLAEVIVVDDGSTDSTAEIAEKEGCTVIRNEVSMGPSAARNAAARRADGEYIVFVDSDILIPENTLEVLHARFERNTDCHVIVIARSPVSYYRNLSSRYKNYWTSYNWYKKTKTDVLNASALVIHRSVFLLTEGFNESIKDAFYEDDELGYRLNSMGFTAEVEKEISVVHMKKFSPGSLLKRDMNTGFAQYLVSEGLLLRDIGRLRYSSVSLNLLLSYPVVVLTSITALIALFSPVFSSISLLILSFCVLTILVMDFDFWTFINKHENTPATVPLFIVLFSVHVFFTGNAQVVGWLKALMKSRK